MITNIKKKMLILGAGLVILGSIALLMPGKMQRQSAIVQGTDLATAREAVLSVGGEITHELGIIKSVGANLSKAQMQKLRGIKGIRKVYQNSEVETSVTTPEDVVDTGTPDVPGCTVTGESELKFGGDSIEWEITNTSDVDIYLDSVMLLWPASNGLLTEVKRDGDKIYDNDVYGISATFDATDWIVNDDKLKIKHGDHRKLVFKFEKVLKEQQAYEIRAFFRENCSIDFPLSPEVLFGGDSDKKAKRSFVTTMVGANQLHDQGIDGTGIGVAVIDSGIWDNKYLREGSYGNRRIVAQYDSLEGKEIDVKKNSDRNGHGSHVSSIVASSRYKDGEFNGIAPNVNFSCSEGIRR